MTVNQNVDFPAGWAGFIPFLKRIKMKRDDQGLRRK